MFFFTKSITRYDVSLPLYLSGDRALYRQMGLGMTPNLVSLTVVELYAAETMIGEEMDAFEPG